MENFELKTIEKGIYKHYKGNLYEVIDTVIHSETLETLVLYKPLYKEKPELWVRPYLMFLENVILNEKQVRRFVKVD